MHRIEDPNTVFDDPEAEERWGTWVSREAYPAARLMSPRQAARAQLRVDLAIDKVDSSKNLMLSIVTGFVSGAAVTALATAANVQALADQASKADKAASTPAGAHTAQLQAAAQQADAALSLARSGAVLANWVFGLAVLVAVIWALLELRDARHKNKLRKIRAAYAEVAGR